MERWVLLALPVQSVLLVLLALPVQSVLLALPVQSVLLALPVQSVLLVPLALLEQVFPHTDMYTTWQPRSYLLRQTLCLTRMANLLA